QTHLQVAVVLAVVRAARIYWNGAAASFSKACELSPQVAAAHYGLARIYERLGNKEKFSQELSLYTSSKGLGPPFADPLLADVLALTALPSDGLRQAAELANRGELPEAAAAYERLLAENPKLEKAHVSLISLYGRLGQVEKAEGHFQAAVRLDPHDPDCYFEHG